MFGDPTCCVFMVFSNPRTGDAAELARWYRDVHAVDAIKDGPFSALRRYEAVGDYGARYLAIWEGPFKSLSEAKAGLTPQAGRQRPAGRITPELEVVWSALGFLTRSTTGPTQVSTLTLAEGHGLDVWDEATYIYGPCAFFESGDEPNDVMVTWEGRGKPGIAPHGPYRNIFEHPDEWPPVAAPIDGTWVSHWQPILSVGRQDL